MTGKIHTIVLLFAFAIASLLVLPSPADAHYPWIGLTDYTPDRGADLNLTIGWGHHYPMDSFLKQEALESILLIGPADKAPKLVYKSEVEVHSEEGLTAEGAYVIAVQRKAGFYTKTATGGKSASKKGLKDVLRCSYSHMCAKAIANVGTTGRVDKVVGMPIEVIPLANPAQLRSGDYLPIRVEVNGKPYSGQVLATYAGFSTDKNTFAYATATDKKGHARIRILTPGIWLIKVNHEVAYPDQSECDVTGYVGTLTFSVE